MRMSWKKRKYSKLKWRAVFLIILVAGGLSADALKSKKSPLEKDGLFLIPIIVHVVYNEEEENISSHQIQQQISATTSDFRARNADLHQIIEIFRGTEADVEIEFFLADTILNTTTPGVRRVFSDFSPIKIDNLFNSETGGSDPIKPDQFLNIWVGNLPEGFLGVNSSIGVGIDFKFFGTGENSENSYSKGRTLTHELGHFFSLNHLWGVGGCTSDDGVADTPNQKEPIGSCQSTSVSCGSVDMTQNFMNLADDDCSIFFTKGQKQRIRQYILVKKFGLIRHRKPILVAVDFEQESIIISPNPTSGKIVQISNVPAGTSHVIITSIEGEFLREIEHHSWKKASTLNLTDLSSGVYLAHFTGVKSRRTVKIILE